MWRVGVPLAMSFLVRRATGEVSYDSLSTGAVPRPPSYVFGVVWTALYLLLGGVLYRTRSPLVLSLWILNMALNLSWTYVVFVRGGVVAGMYLIVGMIGLSMQMSLLTQDLWSRGMMMPYISWLIVALILNVEMVRASKREKIEK